MISPTPDFEWSEYFEAAEKKALHPLFSKLTPYLSAGLSALDLGCGVGHGTAHLCEQGLHVTAVDASAEALARLRRRIPPGASPRLIESDFLLLAFEAEEFDVVTATNALYFLSPPDFAAFWPKLVSWIRVGGIFMGQFMGPNDSWSYRRDYNAHSPDEVRDLFAGFALLYFHDDERDSENITGKMSHNHVVHVLARKL